MSSDQVTTKSGQEKGVIELTVNGKEYKAAIEPRMLLSDFLRDELRLTGTHIGCEHGICGACTILMNGRPVRSCLMFGVQANGASLQTVEGLEAEDGSLHPLQKGFWEKHGLQCGFCTPGFLMTAYHFLQEHSDPTREEIREAVSGNLCRCTGYQGIIDAIESAAKEMREGNVPK